MGEDISFNDIVKNVEEGNNLAESEKDDIQI